MSIAGGQQSPRTPGVCSTCSVQKEPKGREMILVQASWFILHECFLVQGKMFGFH